MNATTGWDPQGRKPSNQRAAALEREGDEIRAHMDDTLDEIERRLSPQQLMDRSLGFVREYGSAFLREAGDTVRRHPVPALLTAAGIAWLTVTVSNSRRDRGGSHIDEDMDSFDEFAEGHGYASGSYATGMNAADRAGAQIAQLIREQPVLVGALALAGGALLGAALPSTEYENRMMGPARDRAMDRVRETGREQYEKVREAVKSSTGDPSETSVPG